MDYDNNDKGSWDWHRNPYVQKAAPPDISECLWKGVPQNQEDLSYMLDDETTPVKACGDLGYQVNQRVNRNKELEEEMESFSQTKRRRMLQFDNEPMNSSQSSEDLTSAFLQSNEGIDAIEAFVATDWVSGYSENTSASGYECLDESPNEWIEQCFNDPDHMQFNPDDIDFSGVSDDHTDITSRESFIRAPTKLATPVAYPFAFIKPSRTHGDVTLKDINQRIRTPPPPKSKEKEPDISPFSGKPVVGKTKIRTEGGKGSITIMRTKG